MKNTVKLFGIIGIIALAALIGFAGCDTGNTTSSDDITWTAVADGTANTATSTKITFTFFEAVSGLGANDITLTAGTGSATKGALTGSGTSWDLGITVTTAGTVSVTVTKAGVSATAQSVTVHKKADDEEPAHPISGRTTWLYDPNAWATSKVEFSTISGNSGTYELKGYSWDSEDYDDLTGEGSYTWNESAQTVTLTATKVSGMDSDYQPVLLTQSEAEAAAREAVQQEVEDGIEYYLIDWDDDGEPDMTQEDAEAQYLEDENGYRRTNYETIEEFIEGETAKKVKEVGDLFAPRPYTYFFKNDGETLILLEALPEAVGTDELAGKTFHGYTPGWGEPGTVNENETYVFSATGKTFTATLLDLDGGGDISVTGSYSYDSNTKQVYLKPDTINNQTPAQFYDAVEPDEWSNYPTEDDERTAQTNQTFTLTKCVYNLDENFLMEGGGISGLSATRGSPRQRSR